MHQINPVIQLKDQEFSTVLAKQEMPVWDKILKNRLIKGTKQLFLKDT